MGCVSSTDLQNAPTKTIKDYPNIVYPDSDSDLYMQSDSSEVTNTVFTKS